MCGRMWVFLDLRERIGFEFHVFDGRELGSTFMFWSFCEGLVFLFERIFPIEQK